MRLGGIIRGCPEETIFRFLCRTNNCHYRQPQCRTIYAARLHNPEDRKLSQDKNIEIDVDQLMSKIRSQISQGPVQRVKRNAKGVQFQRPGWIKAESKQSHSGDLLKQLTDLHGQEFIQAAYLAILGRDVDQQGLAYYLPRLSDGSLSKIDILGSLRYSAEGRAAGVALSNLRLKFLVGKFARLPVLGRLFSVVFAIVRLPGQVRSIRVLEQELSSKFRDIEDRLDTSFRGLEANLPLLEEMKQHVDDHSAHLGVLTGLQSRAKGEIDDHSAHLGVLTGLQSRAKGEIDDHSHHLGILNAAQDRSKQEIDDHSEHLGLLSEQAKLLQQQIADALNELTVVKSLRSAVNDHGTHLGTNSERLKSIEASLEESRTLVSELSLRVQSEIRAQRNSRLSSASVAPVPETKIANVTPVPVDGDLDAFYVDLEDRFRGDEQSVKDRLAVYLPRVLAASQTDQWLGALDVGCGRGEWIQLLGDNEVVCRGLDLNQIMVSECVEQGFDVMSADAVSYLAGQAEGSLSVITGFHVIEHIPFPASLKFLEQCFRVLADGGLLILETPNPENLDVGGHNFYYDPTHNNPIPPALCKFMLESAGFFNVEIERLNSTQPSFADSDDPNVSVLQSFLSDRFMVPPDYAVIARK
jgi:SAM-dependent methyltransferase